MTHNQYNIGLGLFAHRGIFRVINSLCEFSFANSILFIDLLFSQIAVIDDEAVMNCFCD
jgi:hypothetical protein